MRIVSLGLIWLAALAVPASAENFTGTQDFAGAQDFTGAYVGVNAGYALSGGDRTGAGPGFPAPDGARTPDMPPSARQASEALRARNLRDRPSLPR